MRKNQRRSNKGRRPRKHGLFLHDCPACDNKWTAPFEVKHCFRCGLDERQDGGMKAIKRRFVETVKCDDGQIRLKLYLAKRPKEDINVEETVN